MEVLLPTILFASRETQKGADYFFNNATRGGPTAWVVQRTESGRAFFQTPEGTYPIPKTSAMLFIHGEKTRYGCFPADASPYRNAYLTLQGTGFQDIFQHLRHQFGPALPLPETFAACAQFQELINARINHSFRERYQEAESILRFFLTWLRELNQSASRDDPTSLLYERLRNEFHRPFSLKEFAKSHAMSREHLSRKFREKFGIPPATLLRETRMQQARILLETTSLSIAQVGAQCGYPDANSFSRTFRKTFGYSPSCSSLTFSS